jgi:hypothetical protein
MYRCLPFAGVLGLALLCCLEDELPAQHAKGPAGATGPEWKVGLAQVKITPEPLQGKSP